MVFLFSNCITFNLSELSTNPSMQCTVEYRWMPRRQAGEGSTMEERLDMETERSGIVSANATVRRRRRFSNIEMKRKLER